MSHARSHVTCYLPDGTSENTSSTINKKQQAALLIEAAATRQYQVLYMGTWGSYAFSATNIGTTFI